MSALLLLIMCLSASVWGVCHALGFDPSIPKAIVLGSAPLLPIAAVLQYRPRPPIQPPPIEFKTGAVPPRQPHMPEPK